MTSYGHGPLLRLPARLAAMAIVLAVCAAPGPVASQGQPSAPLYAMTDQWPRTGAAAAGVIQRPVSMDVSADGLVFISDPGAGGVHRMLPGGQFLSLLGAAGSRGAELLEAGPLAIGPAPDLEDHRLYVVDAADDRVVVFDLDGQPTDVWPNVFGAVAIAAAADGPVFVADRYSGWIRAFDLFGAGMYTWGSLGTGEGEFDAFTDVSALLDGSLVAVGDLDGRRVQLFDVRAAGEDKAPTLLRTIDLLEPAYDGCLADVVHLLGEEDIWVGQGEHACRLVGDAVTPAIAPGAHQDTICRDTVTLPLVRPQTSQFYALALHDPNLGPCGDKATDRETSVVVVQYRDSGLRQVAQVWPAAARSSFGVQLIAPRSISWVGDGRLAVADESPYLNFFRPDGRHAGSIVYEAPDPPGNVDSYLVRVAAATEKDDEFLAYYEHDRQQQRYRVQREFGVGRFKEAIRYYAGEPVSVFEPVWSDVLESLWVRFSQPSYASRQYVEIDLAYNAVTDEAVLLYYRRDQGSSTQDARLMRWRAGDGAIAPGTDVDLANDLELSPFIDLSIGSDGRAYALDALDDRAKIVGTDGQLLGDVTVPADAWQVTGGPNGELLSLRASGYVEMLASDGSVATSFDGRPFPASDPTTLTDLAAGEDGQVFTLDGQVGVVSVFEQSDDADAVGPAFASCLVHGDKTAAPEQAIVGQPVTITLKLDGQCGLGETPTDVTLVVPADEVDDVAALRNLLAHIDIGAHRVGLVSYWDTAKVELELSDAAEEVAEGIRGASRTQWGTLSRRQPRLAVAIAAAHEQLAGEADRRRVMILFRPADDLEPEDTAELEAAADAAKADGIEMVLYQGALGFNSLVSRPENVVDTVAAAQRLMVDYHRPSALARQLVLTDTLGSGMELVPGSLQPLGNANESGVWWRRSSVEVGGAEFRLQVVPRQPGRHATNGLAVARYVDGWGHAGEIEFASPVIDVDPAPTPTATATPAPRATSTPANREWVLHVPLSSKRATLR